MKNNIKSLLKEESSSILLKLIQQSIFKLIKIFLIYTPLLIFWLIFFSVDFNGSLLISEFQKFNKETVFIIYRMVSMLTLVYFGLWVLLSKTLYDNNLK